MTHNFRFQPKYSDVGIVVYESPSHNFGFYKFTRHLMMTVCHFQLFFEHPVPVNVTIVFLDPFVWKKKTKRVKFAIHPTIGIKAVLRVSRLL